jgi:hypothetical protein
MEILTCGLSHTQYAISVLSLNFASDRLKDADVSLKIKKNCILPHKLQFSFPNAPLHGEQFRELA